MAQRHLFADIRENRTPFTENGQGRDLRPAAELLRDPARAAVPRSRNLFWFGYPVVRLMGENDTPVHFGLDTGAQIHYADAVAQNRIAYPLTAGAPANIYPCAFWPYSPDEPATRISLRTM